MIDMNKPYVGFMDLGVLADGPHKYQLYIVEWPDMGPDRGPEYLAQRLGRPVISTDEAKNALYKLQTLTGVQNAGQLRADFFPPSDWRDGSEHGYTKPDGFIPRKY